MTCPNCYGSYGFEIASAAAPAALALIKAFAESGQRYMGCWFSNIGRTYSATDARLVLVNATIEYTKKLKG